MISDLIRAEDDGAALDHDELLALAVALLGAGTDTTRNQLGAAIDAFCDHPDQWALLRTHPEFAAQAVDEVMRYRPIGFSLSRLAAERSPNRNVSTSPAKTPRRHSLSATVHITAWALTLPGWS